VTAQEIIESTEAHVADIERVVETLREEAEACRRLVSFLRGEEPDVRDLVVERLLQARERHA
jgi:hypothetical protein